MSDWNDHIVGDRMTVDQEFSEQVQASAFTSQEWGLIMTATEFEIEDPGSNDAQIVANTENLPQMMPELENVRKQMPSPPGDGASSSSGGILDSIMNALGMSDDGVDDDELAEARQLTQEYATRLQQHLEKRGKWENVREVATEDSPEDDA